MRDRIVSLRLIFCGSSRCTAEAVLALRLCCTNSPSFFDPLVPLVASLPSSRMDQQRCPKHPRFTCLLKHLVRLAALLRNLQVF